jgi:hypothetical protein
MLYTDNQSKFNEIKGKVIEINYGEEYSSVTLEVGHVNLRNVNLSCKTLLFKPMIEDSKVQCFDNVAVQFYVSSNKKFDRWYSNITMLSINKLAK